MTAWKHYVEIHNETGDIMAYHYQRPDVPTAQLPEWTVYEVTSFPDEYEYYCEGLAFNTETGALSHTQKSYNIIYRRYLDDTDWYVIRQMETGTGVPDEITLKRAQAREGIVDE